MGLNGNDDPNSIPDNIISFGAGASLPSFYDLSQYLPPIGNQGSFGTCVAWAVGYNSKTATEAIAFNRQSSQLSSSAYQISPKDLFTAIPDASKGASNCNGTDFTPALTILQNRGAATMQTAPYSGFTTCYQSNLQSSWTADAANHKIKYYRKIDQNVNAIKTQIANKFPVMIGAKVYANFQNWRSSSVYSSFSGGFSGYHAMAIIGYDDSKGSNGAFKLVNSWGGSWGTSGYVWVDYNFLINQFCMSGRLFIMANENGNVNPPPPPPNTSGVDLAAWVFSDVTTFPASGVSTERNLTFNVYNIGSQALQSSSKWSFYYLYYNAYNANDYGVLFYDNFTNTITPNTYSCPNSQTCNFNYSIPANSSFASVVFNQSNISRRYYVPGLTGYYYLVLFADATRAVGEQNEQNNIFYTTSQSPKFFSNGYSNKPGEITNLSFQNPLAPDRQNLFSNNYNTSVNAANPNAYTPEEIIQFLKEQKTSGKLQQKIDAFAKQNNAQPYKK
jgi:hypothetical protein